MLFTLEILKAAEGDCLLLHWGTVADPKLAVIDGGPGNIYETSLLPRLTEIAKKRGIERLDIDLAIVSHIDADHITGIKKLFSEMERYVDEDVPDDQRLLRVARLWHNTFDDILGNKSGDYYKTITSSIPASLDGEPNPKIEEALQANLKAGSATDAADALFHARAISEILAGQADGRDLRILMEKLRAKNWVKFSLNSPFKGDDGATLLTGELKKNMQLVAGLWAGIYGPLQSDIEALQTEFDKYLTQKGISAKTVLAAYADKSIPNLSSIVALVGMGDAVNPLTILLTGDARGDKIQEGLKKRGVLKSGKAFFNVLKVPHHGSERNIDPDFFENLHADHYVFSASGKYENPDRAAVKWLLDARGKDAVYDIYLTYPVADIDRVRETVAKKQGKSWDSAKDSLSSLFAAYKGYKFRLHAGRDGRIDLGSEALPW